MKTSTVLKSFAKNAAKFVAGGSVAGSVLMGLSTEAATPAPATTVVLVHGAFADGSSWSKVIPLLQAKGLRVVAVQNPLTSLADDVKATQHAIDLAPGAVILVGHSWAGSVITQAGSNDKVKALVYVAAFAPPTGSATLDEVKLFPVAPGFANLAPNAQGNFILPAESVATNFAQDLPASETAVMAATQGETAASGFGEKIVAAAWLTRPSYYIVSTNDRMINPDYERAASKKIGAKVTELKASHAVMLSQPQKVAGVILQAVADHATSKTGK